MLKKSWKCLFPPQLGVAKVYMLVTATRFSYIAISSKKCIDVIIMAHCRVILFCSS